MEEEEEEEEVEGSEAAAGADSPSGSSASSSNSSIRDEIRCSAEIIKSPGGPPSLLPNNTTSARD